MPSPELILKLEKIKKNSLVFSTRVKNIKTCTEYRFYKGNVSLIDFYYTGEYDVEDKTINIFNYVETELYFTYEVSFENNGGQNCNKRLTDDWMRFCGEDVLILPDTILFEADPGLNAVTIDFNKSINGIDATKTIQAPRWGDINNIMKSCYLFSTFKRYTVYLQEARIDFIFDDTFLIQEHTNIIEQVKYLFAYYELLFQEPIPHLTICFYQGSDQGCNRFSKASSSIIGLTFNRDELKDWQRLSNCLFHAFFDFHFPIYELHHAPYTWLREGLSTYYEAVAITTVGKPFYEQFNFDLTTFLQNLYTRYLYFKFKDEARLKMSPMQEPYIKSDGRLSFLYYTQAPLLILFLDQLVGVDHAVLEWLIRYASHEFEIKNMMDDLLGINSSIFVNNYLFGIETIDLFDYLKVEKLDRYELLQNINEYEYTLYTWFSQEDEHYINHHVDYPKFEQLTSLAKTYQLHFADSWIEEKIHFYHENLYQLLLIHQLHLWVCGVDRLDLSLRHFIVNNPYQVERWEDFLKTIK